MPRKLGLLTAFLLALLSTARAADKPNIVYILCDDLGYGDVQSFNLQRGKIATPNIDRLARQGMVFTNAHSSSAVCTPTRYSILTGRYNWRSQLQSGVLGGYGKPLIDGDRPTVADFLHQQGYATACLGKWHLGLQFGPQRFESPIVDGPLQHGFDHFFGIAASLDMPPFAWIEDDRFTELPSVEKTFYRKGLAAPGFEAVDVVPTLTHHAEAFVRQQSAAAKPFFLYLPYTAPHTPIVPTEQWQGKSGLGDYGDFVMQVDAAIGRVVEAIDQAGLGDNTIVIVASDNGFAPAAGPEKLEAAGHFPSADYRGYKADIWEGGHRVPFVVRWPRVVAAGGKCDQLVELADFFATAADIVGTEVPAGAAGDSFSLLPLLAGTGPSKRPFAIHHSVNGCFAIRQDNWKLELCPGSGGWGDPRDKRAREQGLPDVQLYDLQADVGEQRNLESERPEVVRRLTELLEQAIARGRITPGPDLANDVPIAIRKD